MRVLRSSVCAVLLASALGVLGCRAQLPATGAGLSPELARRVEILIRKRTKLPPDYTMAIGARMHSDIPDFDQIDVTFSQAGNASKPITFLLSKDGKTLAQFNRYDISQDPKLLVSSAGRPARGGPDDAPVKVVVFDDLECPFCSKMHAQLFPALVERYGKQVNIVYRDFPISQHPWAMRAAIDSNCVGAGSGVGYWNVVDYIHAHASELGGTEKSLQKALDTLDSVALDEAKKDGLKVADVQACIKKQDDTTIKASLKLGEELGVEATPVLFINGEKLEGAYPLVDVFRMVDEALVADGKTPPTPYAPPVLPSATTKAGN